MTMLPFRLTILILAFGAGGGFVSCTSDSGPDGNIFLSDRAPRYGHGGTENPRYKYGATETAEAAARGETKYLKERKPRDETRSESGETGSSETAETREEPASTEGESTEAPPSRVEPPAETEKPDPEPKPKPQVAEDIPYATPVPGQDGKVYSPFHNGGYVDVSGMPSGSKARCPYTKKIFRVP